MPKSGCQNFLSPSFFEHKSSLAAAAAIQLLGKNAAADDDEDNQRKKTYSRLADEDIFSSLLREINRCDSGTKNPRLSVEKITIHPNSKIDYYLRESKS